MSRWQVQQTSIILLIPLFFVSLAEEQQLLDERGFLYALAVQMRHKIYANNCIKKRYIRIASTFKMSLQWSCTFDDWWWFTFGSHWSGLQKEQKEDDGHYSFSYRRGANKFSSMSRSINNAVFHIFSNIYYVERFRISSNSGHFGLTKNGPLISSHEGKQFPITTRNHKWAPGWNIYDQQERWSVQ